MPNQITSLRSLQKASYFTRGKSLSFNDEDEAGRVWGAPSRTPSPSHGISSTGSTPIVAGLQAAGGAPASGSSHLLFPLTRTFFSQILIRVACSLTSFCPYPNVTISVTPSPDTTPNPPPARLLPPCSRSYSPELLELSPGHTAPSHTYGVSGCRFSSALHSNANCTRTGTPALSAHCCSPSSQSLPRMPDR